MFNIGLGLSKKIHVNEATRKYDDEAVKILSEFFDKLNNKVIKEFDCTEEEFDDVETRLFKEMGKSIDIIKQKVKEMLVT